MNALIALAAIACMTGTMLHVASRFGPLVAERLMALMGV